MATTLQAPARNAPLTIVGMTMAAHGAMENASGGTMNAPRHTLVKRAILQGRELMANDIIISECLTEKDISYYGNDVNNGLENIQGRE